MKKILIIIVLFLIISPIFAQRTRSNYGRGRPRRVESKEIDPNNVRNNPSKDEETLEDRIDELERAISILSQDYRILEMKFKKLELEVTDYKIVKRKEEKRKEEMTEEERDRAAGISPIFPELKYGSRKNSDEYNDGYNDGYNDAYEYDEVDSWEWDYGEVDSGVGKDEQTDNKL